MDASTDPGVSPDEARPPGETRRLGEQAGRLRDAVGRLIRAHVDLARAEFSEIADQVKRLLGLLGLALAALLFAFLLLSIGLPLFLGEWLFGSLGWGILHGTLLTVAIAVAAAVAALGARPQVVWLPALVGAVSAVVVALLLGLDLAFRGGAELARRAGTDLGLTLPTGWQNAIAGAAGGAVIGGLLLLVFGAAWRRTGSGALGGLFAGTVLGAFLGAFFGSVRFGGQVGAAIGLTIGLLVWIAGMAAAATSIDVSARFERFAPTTTIETAKETWEWLRRRITLASR